MSKPRPKLIHFDQVDDGKVVLSQSKRAILNQEVTKPLSFPFTKSFLLLFAFCLLCNLHSRAGGTPAAAQETESRPIPPVAIHVSEATTTQWETLGGPHTERKYWHIWGFLLEALKGDGTPFEIVSDKEIEAGQLLQQGEPSYPILISLASTCQSDETAEQIEKFVQAGGHLYLGSTSGTCDQEGKARVRKGQPCFALPSLDMIPTEMKLIGTVKKVADDPLLAHFPWPDVMNWLLPRAANSIGYRHPLHWLQQIKPGSTKVLLMSEEGPILCVASIGQGRVIFHSEFCPLAGYSGYVVDNIEYSFFRNAINAAYQARDLPLVRLASWPYPAVAAFKTRHDHFLHKGASDLEALHGLRGEWLLRTNNAIGNGDWDQLPEMIKNGSIIGSHTLNEYTLDSGTYATAEKNVRESLDALTPHLKARPKVFVAPGMMAFRDSSLRALVDNGLLTTGDMSHGPFPNFALKIGSAGTYGPDSYWPILEIPVSRTPAPPNQAWHNLIYSHMEDMPLEAIQETVDLTYALGGLINIYDHVGDPNQGIRARWPHPGLEHFKFYLKCGLSKPRIWKTDPLQLLAWWKERQQCQITSADVQQTANGILLEICVERSKEAAIAVDVQLPNGVEVTSVSSVGSKKIAYFVEGSLLKIQPHMSSKLTIELKKKS